MTATASSGTAKVTTPADDQILITREFDAPKNLVYQVWTTPELIKRWWSGGLGEVTIAEVDLRVGGRWRYVMVAPDGGCAFHGEYREVVPNERLVLTEVFEMDGRSDDDAVVNTVTFTEDNGRTTLTMLVQAKDRATRDIILDSGMEEGMQQGWDLAEQLAVSLAEAPALSPVVSKDGTPIAFDRQGSGPAIVLVSGGLADRSENAPLAEELARHFTVYNYDRRGRGLSGDTLPYALEREIEDLEALIAEAG